MTTEALKSTAITNMDATPRLKATAGVGARDVLREVSASITSTTGKTSGSTYQLVRIPTTASVKKIVLDSAAQGSSTALDFGLYYSSDNRDGTPAALAGTVVDQDFFASAVDVSSAVRASDITNESGTYTIDKRLQPIWQAAGLSADPGGFFDIVATNTATINTGALFGISVTYCV
jgi:hypothetical protein